MMPRDETDLFRLVYRSRSAVAGTAEDVRQAIDTVVAVSQRRNAAAGVTGALMFTHLYFVQALEGPASAVEETFDRICCDLRHTSVEVVECGPVLELVFGDWSMRHFMPDTSTGAPLDCVEDQDELADAAATAMKLMVAVMKSKTLITNEASGLAPDALHSIVHG